VLSRSTAWNFNDAEPRAPRIGLHGWRSRTTTASKVPFSKFGVELWCIREVVVDLVECIATNDARRAAGDLEPGARDLLDPATLAFFARCNGFPRTPAWLFLPDYDELVAADLLWRYGWTASEAGLAFEDWKTEHRQEMLDVMKHVLH